VIRRIAISILTGLLAWSGCARGAYLGSWSIDDYLTFTCNTHTPATGAATDADAVPAYRIYEDETAVPITTGDMAKLDDAGTTGFYSERIQLLAATGFEQGKCYTIYISAAVGGVTGTKDHSFQIEAEVNVSAVGGTAQTAGDLADLVGDVKTRVELALPAVAPDGAGGLPISDAGGLDMDAMSGVTLAGTASGGSATTIALVGGVATDNYYNGQIVKINSGTGIGQSRTILAYLAAGTVATVTRDWAVAPDNTSVFSVHMADYPAILEAGTAQAGSAATITLDAGASGITSTYVGNHVMITGGTGIGQTRLISAYNDAQVATITPVWTTNPDATSVYQIIPMARVDVSKVAGTLQTANDNGADINLILADTAELQGDWADAGRLDALIDLILADTGELQGDWADAGRLDALIDLILADTGELQGDWADAGRLDALIDLILADTGELQTDWVDAGRLDALIDAIKAKTDNLPADPADDSDIDGQLATIVADTGELQADWADAGRLDALIDLILADTGELQTDWADAGRLDALIDAIKAKTDNLPADPADDSDIDGQLATIVADTGELQADWADAGRLDALIDLILADTGELQTDWVDAGRLDALIDAIKSKTDNLPADPADDSDIDGQLATIVADTGELQADWADAGRLDALIDLILADTGELQTDWVNGGRLDLLIDLILADTGELQTDWVNGGRLDLLIDLILADTGELQTDWVNGGRLDLLLDAVKAKTDLQPSLSVIVEGTVDTTGVAATTTEFESDDITEATADHYNGRIVIFTSGILTGQATDITDYALNGGRGHFTVTALTEAPPNDCTFTIF